MDGFNMLSLLLPGVAVTYNGEEIGMTNTLVSWEDTVDPAGINCGQDHFMVTTAANRTLQCPVKAPTRVFSLLKAPTTDYIITDGRH